MNRPRVLANGNWLADAVRSWGDGYAVITPDDLEAGEPPAGIEVVVTNGDQLDDWLVASLPDLALVACFSTGHEGIDLVELNRRGIAFTHAAGVNAHDVADHAIALVLATWHGIVTADASVRRGAWREAIAPRRSLQGRRCGVVGMGRVGMAIADRLAALKLDVLWWGPRPKPDARYRRAESLLALARDSDILVIAARGVAENVRQIDGAVIDAVGPDGFIVNVARGLLIDEFALAVALRQGRLGGAGLDVFAEEPSPPDRWANVPHLVFTPHIAGYTAEGGAALIGQLRDNVRCFFADQPLLSEVVPVLTARTD